MTFLKVDRTPPGPGRHPSPPQMLYAVLVGALVGLLFGAALRMPVVGWLTFGFNLIQSWWTPAARESRSSRVVNALVSGAFASVAGVLGASWRLWNGPG